MAKIKIEKTSSLSPKDAFGKIKEFFSNDHDLRKLDSNYKCQFDDNLMAGTAKGSKFEAAMSVLPQAGGSKIQVEVSLPLMLTPFKGFVEKTIQDKLGTLIG
jgi:hypothetical protein